MIIDFTGLVRLWLFLLSLWRCLIPHFRLSQYPTLSVFRSKKTPGALCQKVATSESEVSSPILGYDDRGRPVFWPVPSDESNKNVSVAVFGSSGCGKTIAIANAIAQEVAYNSRLPEEKRTSFFIVDPKNDLGTALCMAICETCPERLTDLIVLDPFAAGSFKFNLNLLALGSTPVRVRAMQLASLVAEVSTGRGGQQHLSAGSRQIDLFEQLFTACLTVRHERASVLLILDALSERHGLKRLAAACSSESARQFLLSAKLSDELVASCSSRLRTAFSVTQDLEQMVAADGSIQFDDLTAPGRIVVIKLGLPVGGLFSLVKLYANLLVKLSFDYLLQRPSPWSGHSTRVIIDEFQLVCSALNEISEAIYTTGRSRGLSLCAITQTPALVNKTDSELLRVMFTNSPTKICGRLSAPDSEILARELGPPQGVEESLSSIRSRFVGAVTNLEDRHFYSLTPGQRQRFVSTTVDMDAWQQGYQQHSAQIEAIEKKMALPKDIPPRLTLSELSPSPVRGRRAKKASGPQRTNKQAANVRSKERSAENTQANKKTRPQTTQEKKQKTTTKVNHSPKSKWG